MLTLDDLLAENPTNPDVETGFTVEEIISSELEGIKKETGFTRWALYSAASSVIGLAQMAEDLGLGVDVDEDEVLYYRNMAEVASDDNPVLGLAGMLAGSTVDVVGGGIIGGLLKGLGKITVRLGAQGWNNLFTQGLAGGAIGGFLEPILTEEDSTLLNVGVGASFGGALGGAIAGASRLFKGPETPTPIPTPEVEQLALPAPQAPVALLPSPEIATPRIPFQAGTEGKPATAGGVIPLRQEATGLPTARVGAGQLPVVPGQPITPQLALPRPVDFSPQDSLDALGQVRKDLFNIIENAPEKKAVVKAQVRVKQANGRIEAWKNQKPSKARDDKIKAEERKIQADKETIKQHEVAQQAKKELVRIDNGRVSPLVLDRIKNVADQKQKVTAQKQAVAPTPPPNVRTVETAGRPIIERRATGAESTVGAQQVSPATAMVDQAVIEEIPTRSTQATAAQGPVYGQGGRVSSAAEERRRKMYQDGEDIGRQYFFEPEDLLGKGYSFANVEEAATVLQREIDDMITEGNFKDAGDWIVKTFETSRTKTLTPVEQLVASRVFAVASDNLNKLLPVFRKLAKEQNLNSKEAVRLTDDMQVTKELMTLMRQLERIDEASRRNISNALRNYKLANKYQQKHQRQLMENKIISDLFFGVRCG
jgi:hypothetical protein